MKPLALTATLLILGAGCVGETPDAAPTKTEEPAPATEATGVGESTLLEEDGVTIDPVPTTTTTVPVTTTTTEPETNFGYTANASWESAVAMSQTLDLRDIADHLDTDDATALDAIDRRGVYICRDVHKDQTPVGLAEAMIAAEYDLGLDFSTVVTIDGSDTFSNISTLTSTGPTSLNGTINTTGLQSYASAVTLLGATDLTASNVTFGSTVAGGASPLNVTGDLFIDGAVTNLGGLDVTGNTDLGADITTVSGGQTYNGTVVLTGVRLIRARRATVASSQSHGAAGSAWAQEWRITRMGGSRACRARAITVLPVPVAATRRVR